MILITCILLDSFSYNLTHLFISLYILQKIKSLGASGVTGAGVMGRIRSREKMTKSLKGLSTWGWNSKVQHSDSNYRTTAAYAGTIVCI